MGDVALKSNSIYIKPGTESIHILTTAVKYGDKTDKLLNHTLYNNLEFPRLQSSQWPVSTKSGPRNYANVDRGPKITVKGATK